MAEGNPKMYTEGEVSAVLSKFQATTFDYLVHTIFGIFKITEGPIYEKYKRRFNNIVFNNPFVIAEKLTVTFLCRQAFRQLFQDLVGVRYVSCLFPNTKNDKRPMLLQFFHREIGVQHRMVEFLPERQITESLAKFELLEKVVGFCGDYCYKDATSVGGSSGYVGSLQILCPHRVFNVPYSDGFLDRLFDVLLDYLPGDVIKSVTKLGETLIGLSGHSTLAREVVMKYKKWLRSDTHILASDYVKFLVSNFDSINSYLLPYRCLPRCIGAFFSHIDQRFFLSFMAEIYQIISSMRIHDNNAVSYYDYLLRVRDVFQKYEDRNYIPLPSFDFLNYQIATTSAQVKVEQSEIDALFKDIRIIIRCTYTRAVRYLDPLIEQFQGFDTYKWILSQSLDLEQVHAAFHNLHHTHCAKCEGLQQEVNDVNIALRNIQTESLSLKWLKVLKECRAPLISEMLEILLSLPAWCTITEELEGGSELEEAKLLIKMNLGLESLEMLEKVDTEGMADAAEVIQMWKIPTLAE